ncbi:hypothetical protein JG688_00013970 [Phytophthora aleatoria]|uniref:Uncharacterized protein n=1 Tax=Phytophthora aleatoria TaxID=2496075 RepID=A0A8J5MDP2_9STRA|nr:hypothetical protein JG688_00013970 [Phytophthora aleatoria]
MYEFRIRWAIELPVAMVSGELKPQEPEKTCSTQLQKLLDAGVPAAAFIETDTGPASGLEFIDASLEQLLGEVLISLCDFAAPGAVGLCVAVAKTAKTYLKLNLDDWDLTEQLVQHAGPMLSLMLSGSAICKWKDEARGLEEAFRCAQSVPLAITCWRVPYSVIGPVCSAIANIKSACDVTLDLQLLSSEPISTWGWLMHAMCCGFSRNNNEQNVAIIQASLTQTYLDVIEQVLKTRFPAPVIGSELHEYGYVDLQEGAEFLLTSEDSTLVATTACRCRAVHYTGTGIMASMARIVIPGYGLCTVKIGDGAVFIRDNAPQILFQEYQSYAMDYQVSATLSKGRRRPGSKCFGCDLPSTRGAHAL